MAKIHANIKPHFASFGLISKIFGVMTGAGPFLELVGEVAVKQADKLLRNMLGLAVLYLTLLAGIVILAGGVMLLIIDYTTLPRGVALLLGGLFLIAGSALFMQLSKK